MFGGGESSPQVGLIAATAGHEERSEFAARHAVYEEVDAGVDVDKHLTDIVQVENDVTAPVLPVVAHEMKDAERRLTEDSHDHDGDENCRDFRLRTRPVVRRFLGRVPRARVSTYSCDTLQLNENEHGERYEHGDGDKNEHRGGQVRLVYSVRSCRPKVGFRLLQRAILPNHFILKKPGKRSIVHEMQPSAEHILGTDDLISYLTMSQFFYISLFFTSDIYEFSTGIFIMHSI